MKTAASLLVNGIIPICPFKKSDFLSIYYKADTSTWVGIEESDLYSGAPNATVLADPAGTVVSIFQGSMVIDPKAIGAVFSNDIPISIKAGTVRLHDTGTSWNLIETAQGVYNAEAVAKLDYLVDRASSLGCDIIYVVYKTPAWAATGGVVNNGPTNMAYLSNFLNWLYSRYGNKISHYEGWNEPNVANSYLGSLSSLVAHQKTIYETVKANNGSLQVITPSWTFISGVSATLGFTNFMTAAYADSGSAGYYADIIGYHFYSESSFLHFNRNAIETLKTAIAGRAGASSMPVWNTECGDSKASRSSFNEMAAVCFARGVSRVILYSWDNNGRGNMKFSTVGEDAFNHVADMWQGKTLTSLNTVRQPTMDGSVNVGGAPLGAVINGVRMLVD